MKPSIIQLCCKYNQRTIDTILQTITQLNVVEKLDSLCSSWCMFSIWWCVFVITMRLRMVIKDINRTSLQFSVHIFFSLAWNYFSSSCFLLQSFVRIWFISHCSHLCHHIVPTLFNILLALGQREPWKNIIDILYKIMYIKTLRKS